MIKSMSCYSNLYSFIFILLTVYSNLTPAFTKDWLIEFHARIEPDVVKRIAKRYAMVSRGPVSFFILLTNEQKQ